MAPAGGWNWPATSATSARSPRRRSTPCRIETQITRHICVEGWDYIGKWSGVPLRAFLERVGADMTAKYVAFKVPTTITASIDMPTALHPQTILATQYDGAPLRGITASRSG